MCKNTRIFGLKFCFSCFSAEHVNKPNTVLGDAPWLFSLNKKDVKILPENIPLEDKKNAHLLRDCSTVLEPQQVLTILYRE